MSTDEAVTKDLVQTLEDGEQGFAKGADKLTETDAPELAATFRRYSEQRRSFSAELRGMAAGYGDHVEESGTVAAAVHRGWMSLKDALAGSDPKGVLDAAEQGEDHAVKEYDKALEADISAGLRTVVERQRIEVRAAHDDVRALRDAHA
jgi:uncharacterized protein (TIGR02284 family)